MTSEVKNARKSPKQERTEFKRGQFINHTFNEDDKARFKAWLSDKSTDIWDLLDKLTDSGYKLSVKYDSYTDAQACFIQTDDEKSDNYGFILTGRSRSGSLACAAALYRHYVLWECQWPTDTVRHNRLDDE